MLAANNQSSLSIYNYEFNYTITVAMRPETEQNLKKKNNSSNLKGQYCENKYVEANNFPFFDLHICYSVDIEVRFYHIHLWVFQCIQYM